jgi:hypothetical protein
MLPTSDATLIEGRCHCGNVSYALSTRQRLDDVVVRICRCEFCIRHRPRHWSDPQGSLAIAVADAREIVLYRFGHGTADFLICRCCGVYCLAITETDGGFRAVSNLNLALGRDARPRETWLEALAESAEERMQRRGANWTPVTSGWPPA